MVTTPTTPLLLCKTGMDMCLLLVLSYMPVNTFTNANVIPCWRLTTACNLGSLSLEFLSLIVVNIIHSLDSTRFIEGTWPNLTIRLVPMPLTPVPPLPLDVVSYAWFSHSACLQHELYWI